MERLQSRRLSHQGRGIPIHHHSYWKSNPSQVRRNGRNTRFCYRIRSDNLRPPKSETETEQILQEAPCTKDTIGRLAYLGTMAPKREGNANAFPLYMT